MALFEIKLRSVASSPRALTLINGLVKADDEAEARKVAVAECPAGYEVTGVNPRPHRSYRKDGQWHGNWKFK